MLGRGQRVGLFNLEEGPFERDRLPSTTCELPKDRVWPGAHSSTRTVCENDREAVCEQLSRRPPLPVWSRVALSEELTLLWPACSLIGAGT